MRNSSWKHCYETKLHHSQRPVTLYFNMTSHWKWNVMLIFSSLAARKLSKWQLLLQIVTKLFVNVSFSFQGVETITNVGETWENSILADNRKYFVCTKPYWATKHGGWKQIDTQLNTTLLIALGRPDVNTNVQIYWSTMLIQVNVGY